jgi:hypothetical protein
MNVSGQPYNQEVKAVMPALLVCVRHGNTDTSDPTIPNPNLPLTREGFRNGRRAGVRINGLARLWVQLQCTLLLGECLLPRAA